VSPPPEGSTAQQDPRRRASIEQVPPPRALTPMYEPPENNLDRDPFADDAQRRPSRLRRPIAANARRSRRARCAAAVAGRSSRQMAPLRHARSCSRSARKPLR